MTQGPIPPPPAEPPAPYHNQTTMQDVQNKVNAPGISLMVTAVIGFLFQLKSLLIPVDTDQILEVIELMNLEVDTDQIMQGVEAVGSGSIVLTLIGIVFTVIVFIGGMKMRKLENWGLALTASILAVFPCTSPCCCLGIPLGIWAIIVLLDSAVKDGFEQNKGFEYS